MPTRNDTEVRLYLEHRRAMAAFTRLSLIAYREGLISERVLRERLEFIYDGKDVKGSWSDEKLDLIGNEQVHEESCRTRDVHEARDGHYPAEPPPVLHFNLPKDTPMGGWLFSSSDTDPDPSVPHAHWKSHSSKTKLDPYLGWVYKGSKRTDQRLSWSEVNKLWRKPAFRHFARGCIAAALDDPRMGLRKRLKHRGVGNAMKLPR